MAGQLFFPLGLRVIARSSEHDGRTLRVTVIGRARGRPARAEILAALFFVRERIGVCAVPDDLARHHWKRARVTAADDRQGHQGAKETGHDVRTTHAGRMRQGRVGCTL